MNTTATENKGSILIVDDTLDNLRFLSEMLVGSGYEPRAVPNGEMALTAAKASPPDLILLDINMPEMDGYEVFQRLKEDATLREIPVLFISALSETEDKVKALEYGGVDFITKPFQFEEVEARVKTHLQLYRAKRQVQQSLNKLCDLEHLRDSLVHMIIHDLRGPLSVIHGYLSLLEFHPDMDPQSLTDYVFKMKGACGNLMDMISDLIDVNRLEQGCMPLQVKPCNLRALLEENVSKYGWLEDSASVTFEGSGDVEWKCDASIVSRIVGNFIGNALKFTPKDGSITVSLTRDDDGAKIVVADTGPGINPEHHEKIFEKFGQVELRNNEQKYSSGLGLAFCKLAVEAHGGTIGLESELGVGSAFWIKLPQMNHEPERVIP